MIIHQSNDTTNIFDKHYTIKCPHCQRDTNLTAISIPKYEYLARFRPAHIGIVYKCDACQEPIFAKFIISKYDIGNHKILIEDNSFQVTEVAIEPFEYEYLPDQVKTDFIEAANCYAIGCYNAFAAMCRRTIQSLAMDLGAIGKDKVKLQLTELKDALAIDEESYTMLVQIIVDGHDGAHPHLPPLSRERAVILIELMKDVLYQIYVRKAKLQEAARLRQEQIKCGKS